MPGQKQASEIVALMRYYLKEMGTEPYRDGFPTDVSTSPSLIPLLQFGNRAYGILARAGFNFSDFNTAIVSGQPDYPMDPNMGEISAASVTWQGATYVIRDTTAELMDSRVRDWKTQRDYSDPNYSHYAGRPRMYLNQGRLTTLWPQPDGVGTLTFRAYATPGDMIVTTDIPSGLPSDYHGAIAVLGAAICAGSSDADDEGMAARAQTLIAQFQMEYPTLKDLIDARAIVQIQARQKPAEQEE